MKNLVLLILLFSIAAQAETWFKQTLRDGRPFISNYTDGEGNVFPQHVTCDPSGVVQTGPLKGMPTDDVPECSAYSGLSQTPELKQLREEVSALKDELRNEKKALVDLLHHQVSEENLKAIVLKIMIEKNIHITPKK